MKKFFAISLLVLMLLIPAQSAFAKAYIGGSIGADFLKIDEENGYLTSYDPVINKLGYGLSLGYEFNNGFALAFDYSGNNWQSCCEKASLNNFQLYAKYGFFNTAMVRVGAQLGASWDMKSSVSYETEIYKTNCLYIAAGLFANIKVTPELEVYADVKVPFVEWYRSSFENTEFPSENETATPHFGLVNSFYYDAKLGFKYEIYPNVFLGLEGQINTMTYFRPNYYYDEYFDDEYIKARYTGININLGYQF